VRLRLELVPKLHGHRQIKVQSWTGQHWDTLGKVHCASADWREIVALIQDGARLRGITCEVLDHQARAVA
jgi:hypothetical protein